VAGDNGLGWLFTLVSALADPVDLWRISVHSHQGEPLKAVATLQALPEERITQKCLSLGPESDAPGSDAPFLASPLTLNAKATQLKSPPTPSRRIDGAAADQPLQPGLSG